jgi:hypothetical protein
MRIMKIGSVVLFLAAPASAQFFPGRGAVSPPANSTTPTNTASASTNSSPTNNTSSTSTPSGSVAIPPAAQGVPPTPAPAFPGLPVSQSSSGIASGTPPSPLAQDLRTPAALTPSQVAEMQSLLMAQGFYHGPISGMLDGSTRSAIRAYQEAARIPATGQPDAATANTLGVQSPAAASQNFPPFALSTNNQSGVFIQP